MHDILQSLGIAGLAFALFYIVRCINQIQRFMEAQIQLNDTVLRYFSEVEDLTAESEEENAEKQ